MKRGNKGGKSKSATKSRFTIEGEAALLEYARYKPEAILSVNATDATRAKLVDDLSRLGLDVPVNPLSGGHDRDGRSSPVKAEVRLAMQSEADLMDAIETRSPPCVLALDHITDPRNLGAIVRSAAYYGVSHVVVPERRQVLLTDASVGTSQGGFARTNLVCVVNLGRTVTALKDKGYWVLGAAMNGEPLEQLAGTYDKTVLVLGAEDKGLSAGLEKKSDRLIAITGPGGEAGGLDSLNVAVAAGILLHGLSR